MEWIGEIPESWELAKIGQHFKQRNEKVSDLDFKPLSVTKNGIVPQLDNAAKSSNHNDRKLVKKGDFVINSRSDRKQSSGIAYENGSVSLINLVIKSRTVDTNFTNYLLKNAGFAEEFYRWGNGIVADLWSTKWDSMKRIPIPLPELAEQKKIANVIRDKVKIIDTIISETQQSIDELKKYKQALITETVTKGLDKNVEMKDSGIDWMGSIPSQWRIAKMNSLFRIVKNIANDQNPRVLSVTQSGLKIKDITVNVGQMAADYSKYQSVHKGQFVMNHMDLLTGWIDLSNFTGVTSPDYRVFETKNNDVVFPSFFLYIFQICYTNKIFYGLGQGVSNVGRWRLQTDKFVNFYLPVPSYAEQVKIVEYLKQRIAIINKIIEQKAQLLNHLNIYKQSLIYEYVTGKKEA